jgi:hypothetical protein
LIWSPEWYLVRSTENKALCYVLCKTVFHFICHQFVFACSLYLCLIRSHFALCRNMSCRRSVKFSDASSERVPIHSICHSILRDHCQGYGTFL